MKKGERYNKRVKLSRWGGGKKPHTAQRGSEYVFITEDGERLIWDTTKYLDASEGDIFNIIFTVVNTSDELNYLGNNYYEISRVKLVDK